MSEIYKVTMSDGGLAQALTTIRVCDINGNKLKGIFMMMYGFERKQLKKYLIENNILVEGNGID